MKVLYKCELHWFTIHILLLKFSRVTPHVATQYKHAPTKKKQTHTTLTTTHTINLWGSIHARRTNYE